MRFAGTAPIKGSGKVLRTTLVPSRRMAAFQLFYDEKKLLGCIYGSSQVRRDFPRFIALTETGRLDLGAMVSRRIGLDEVNDAFRAMQAGEVIRSVIV